METENTIFPGGPAAKHIAKLAAAFFVVFMLGAPQAMALTDDLLTRDEMRARSIQRLAAIEELRNAMLDQPSSHDMCSDIGHIVGSKNFARCWIAAENNAKARTLAVTKADAMAAVLRALLSKPTSTDIKPLRGPAPYLWPTLVHSRA